MHKRLISSLLFICNINSHFITYEFSGGRLGDCLLAYSRAKYFSLKCNMPLIYKPFAYSDKLKLHQIEKVQRPNLPTKKVQSMADFRRTLDKEHIFEIPWFSEVGFERRLSWSDMYLDIEWNNPTFKEELRRCISPACELSLVKPPDSCFSIAVHLRRGGNFDGSLQSESNLQKGNFCDTNAPLKFSPRHFHVSAIKEILKMINEKNVYIYLFTDDHNPKALVNYFKEQLSFVTDKTLIVDARVDKSNNENTNVLEDMFSMLNFNALVRGESSYSIMVGHLGKFKYEVYPIYQHWNGNNSVIDKFYIEVKN